MRSPFRKLLFIRIRSTKALGQGERGSTLLLEPPKGAMLSLWLDSLRASACQAANWYFRGDHQWSQQHR